MKRSVRHAEINPPLVKGLDQETQEVKFTYSCLIEAKNDGFDPTCISRCARGKQKTHKGLVWVFKKKK